MTDTHSTPPPDQPAAPAGSAAPGPHTSTTHPRGLSAGGRNAACRSRAAGGPGLGNGGVKPPLVDWTPVYHRVDDTPDRPVAARNGFAGMGRALHHNGIIDDAALVLLNWLLEESNNKAHAVHVSVRELSEALGWGPTKIKAARLRLEQVGLLTHHNRVYTRRDGSRRFGANRYGFTWNLDLLALIGWREQRTIKMCGPSDMVWNKSWRVHLRRELREQAILSGRAQAERGIALRVVDEIAEQSPSYREAAEAVGLRYRDDPGLAEFALDHLAHVWKHQEAGRYGRHLAQLDMSNHSLEMKVHERYGDDPELLALALAPLHMRTERRHE